MKNKRYTEEQIISILKEHEAGASVPELSRRHAVAENTIYRWKSKFGGMSRRGPCSVGGFFSNTGASVDDLQSYGDGPYLDGSVLVEGGRALSRVR